MTPTTAEPTALRVVRFKFQHDCALARLSKEFPDVTFSVWSGHTVEVLQFSCDQPTWKRIESHAKTLLRVRRSIRSRDGGIIVARVTVDPKTSISRTLESNDCLWMQPMTLRAGWEEYDTITYGLGEEPEKEALTALRRQGTLRVIERQDIESDELLESLFLPMRTVLHAATPRQAEALVAACKGGYYSVPRRTTTAKLASSMGLGRTSYEERLRGGENNLLQALAPFLEQHRVSEDDSARRRKGRSGHRGAAPSGH